MLSMWKVLHLQECFEESHDAAHRSAVCQKHSGGSFKPQGRVSKSGYNKCILGAKTVNGQEYSKKLNYPWHQTDTEYLWSNQFLHVHINVISNQKQCKTQEET